MTKPDLKIIPGGQESDVSHVFRPHEPKRMTRAQLAYFASTHNEEQVESLRMARALWRGVYFLLGIFGLWAIYEALRIGG